VNRTVRQRAMTSTAVAALAVGILVLGIPRVVGGFEKLSGDIVIDELRHDRQVNAGQIARLTKSRESALRWVEDRASWSDLGLARLLAADDPDLDEESRRTALKGAVEAIENGIALAPGDGYVWARLAFARYYLDGPTESVAEALTQSVLITEFDRRLVFERLDVAFAVWERLPSDIRAMFARQVGYGFDVSPKRLASLVRNPERRVRIVAALADTPDRMEKFEAYLRRSGL
jgi:hypothetical protein